MKVIALTILLLMLALIAFGSALSRKKLRVGMCFDQPPMEEEQVIRKKAGQQSGTLILTNGTRLRMVRFKCVAQFVGGAHIGNERKSGG